MSKYLEDYKLVKLACEKAEKYDELKTPKKPIKHYKNFYRCENCEEIFQNYRYQNCCPHCGQALDWSDEISNSKLEIKNNAS